MKFSSNNRSETPPFNSNSNNRGRGSIRSFTAPFNPHSNISPPTWDSSNTKSYSNSKYDSTISKYNNSTTKYGNNGPSSNNNTPLSPQFNNNPAMHDNHFPLIANNRNDLIANSPSFMSSHRMSGIDP